MPANRVTIGGLRGAPAPAGGFSLMQLLAVIAIAGILGSMGVPSYVSFVDRSRTARAVGDMGKIELAIRQYMIEHNGDLPASLADIGHDEDEDPWGNAYRYVDLGTEAPPRTTRAGTAINTDYDLYSIGGDDDTALDVTADQSRDDVIRGGNGAYLGPVTDFSHGQ